MKRVLLTLAGIAVVAVSAAAGYYLYRNGSPGSHGDATAAVPSAAPATRASHVVGKARPEFSLPDLSGRRHSIDEWDGRVIALNFWATWCPPCLKEIPQLISLQSEYGDRGLQIIGIALQKPAAVADFARKHGINYPVLAGEAAVVRVAEDYGNTIGALPNTVVIDRQGRIAYARPGPVTVEKMQKIIRPLL
ncbi:MAG: TlpA disulfide reductase family protein [Gammaproteobacteria bacterium]